MTKLLQDIEDNQTDHLEDEYSRMRKHDLGLIVQQQKQEIERLWDFPVR